MSLLPRCRSIPVHGTELDCLIFGRGKKPLVILPGLSTRNVRPAGLMLSFMYHSFTRDFTVYIMDKPRHIPEGCTVADLAESCAAAMDALGLEKACVLGVSLGGMMAQELAIKHPELVASLVLGLTAARTNPSIESSISRWLGYMEMGDFAAFGRDMMGSMYSASYLKKYGFMLPVAAALSRPKDLGRFMRLANTCLTCESFEHLENISCSTLVIGAGQDKVVSGEASLEIAEKLGCSLYMYDNLGHAAYDEAADFNKRVLDFFLEEAE